MALTLGNPYSFDDVITNAIIFEARAKPLPNPPDWIKNLYLYLNTTREEILTVTRGLYQVCKASRLGTVFNSGEVMVREKNGPRYIIIVFGLKVFTSFLVLSRGRPEALA